MTGYLIDSSAMWRMLRGGPVSDTWRDVIADGALRSCYPQRTEFFRSARNLEEYDEFTTLFDQTTRDAAVPKSAGSWIRTIQRRAAQGGCVNSLSAVDLMICATAVNHNLTIVHDDKDFVTATRFATELREVNVHDGPLELGI
ncbi:PIN domain-containing protein [Nocardia sp. NPDC058497]|uniref:PIN domain-containing protein n=1 Tax=Nocardia sp. NPDC058497 TaxID=3346529 RepID=UPI00364BBEBC